MTLANSSRTLAWLTGPLLAALMTVLPASAEPAQKGAPATAPSTAPGAARGAAAAAGGAQAQGGSDAALKQRVEQLEEQLVDMQVVVGTLQSLARGGGGASTGGGASGGSSAADVRIDGLETQVRALSAQLEQLTQQVRALSNGSRRTEAAPPGATGAVAGPGATAKTSAQSSAQSSAPASTPASAQAAAQPAGGPEVSRFGSTTVTAGTSDPIRGLIDNDLPPPNTSAVAASAQVPAAGAQAPAAGVPAIAAGAPATAAPPAGAAAGVTGATAGSETLAAAPPAFLPPQRAQGTPDNPKQLYETAYGYLMQRDYAAAQTAFEEFLTRYPKDSLAGNAQYWLGEAHFVRGEYKAAAGAFLKGYKEYGSNPRAADSLLKLAMSLDRLGQTDAACSSFNELSTRFPDAPDNVKSRAKTERARIGCR